MPSHRAESAEFSSDVGHDFEKRMSGSKANEADARNLHIPLCFPPRVKFLIQSTVFPSKVSISIQP